MIVIQKNASNDVVLTLKEKSTLTSPYYTFKFESDMTNNVVSCSATNMSTASRYDEFTFIETGSAAVSASVGIINLEPAGYWTYTVYETATSESISIPTSGSVETGRMLVKSATSESVVNSTYDNEQTYTVYTGN